MANGYLTTHILDTAQGVPAAGVRIDLYRLQIGGAREKLGSHVTNEDGRTDHPILPRGHMSAGQYELEFHIGDYFRVETALKGQSPFLDVIPVRFGICDADSHYHVPLLVSPFGYSTYRGS